MSATAPHSLQGEVLLSRPAPNSPGREMQVVRVFHLVESFNAGGSEKQAVEVARRLDPSRYQVTVGCLRAEGPFLEVLQRAQVAVIEFPFGNLRRPRAAYQLLRLAYFLRRGRFDVVHTHELYSNLVGVPAAWLARTPVIISSRRDLGQWWWYTPRRRKILRRIQNLSTFVLANSQAVRDFLVREEGFEACRIRVIHNGVDVERLASVRRDRNSILPGLGENHKLIAMIANMHSPAKGHACLITAARTICRVLPETRFLLIGEGQERTKLEQQAKQMGLQENFLFLGRRTDVTALLSCCDLSVLPSLGEGLPNAVLESLAAGVPVVATRVGGTVEIIEHGVNGLLVPPRSPEALANAILRLLQHPDLAWRLARAGQDQVRTQFSFDRLVRELRQLYEEPGPGTQDKTGKVTAKQDIEGKSPPDPAGIGREEVDLGPAKPPLPHREH